MGSVNITLANGRLGSVLQTEDGVAGMILTGVPETGGYEIGTPVLLTSLSSLAEEGISLAENPFAYRQVKEFYAEAGTGAKLYLMLVNDATTVLDISDNGNDEGARKLLNFANGKIRLLGIMTDDDALEISLGEPVTITNGINAHVYTAINQLNTLAEEYFAAQQPFRCVIGATSYSGTHTALANLTEGTHRNRVAVMLGDTKPGSGACVGLLLGRLSAVPVMRKVSRVRTGQLTNAEAWLGPEQVEAANGDLPPIAGKGFITWWTYPNVGGYFFSGDDTCSAVTDDYHFIARGRVVDKAHILAYTTFVQEVDDEVPVNEDGTMDAGFCKWLSQQIVNQVNQVMVANKEISSVECVIDPAQNVLSTNQVNVLLRLIPVGYATNIEISLGFTNPA